MKPEPTHNWCIKREPSNARVINTFLNRTLGIIPPLKLTSGYVANDGSYSRKPFAGKRIINLSELSIMNPVIEDIIVEIIDNDFKKMLKTSGYSAGQRITTKIGGYIKVMAIAEGYVMARRSGCLPFVEPIKQFDERIKREKYDFNDKPQKP